MARFKASYTTGAYRSGGNGSQQTIGHTISDFAQKLTEALKPKDDHEKPGPVKTLSMMTPEEKAEIMKRYGVPVREFK